MLFAACWPSVVWCVLLDEYDVLRVVCCLLFVGLVFVVDCLAFVVCCMIAVCCSLFAVCCVLFAACCL